MDHVVYVDVKAKELSRLISGEKTMLIRGAAAASCLTDVYMPMICFICSRTMAADGSKFAGG
jgi:hypothetical protein